MKIKGDWWRSAFTTWTDEMTGAWVSGINVWNKVSPENVTIRDLMVGEE